MFSIFNDSESEVIGGRGNNTSAQIDKENHVGTIASSNDSNKLRPSARASSLPGDGKHSKRHCRSRQKATDYRRGYNPDILTFNGVETSFEEYRWGMYIKNRRRLPVAVSETRPAIVKQIRQTPPVLYSPSPKRKPMASENTSHDKRSSNVVDPGRQNVEPLFSCAASPMNAPASPTIHTREAMSDVMAMFQDDAGAACLPQTTGPVVAQDSAAAFSIFCDFDDKEDAQPSRSGETGKQLYEAEMHKENRGGRDRTRTRAKENGSRHSSNENSSAYIPHHPDPRYANKPRTRATGDVPVTGVSSLGDNSVLSVSTVSSQSQSLNPTVPIELKSSKCPFTAIVDPFDDEARIAVCRSFARNREHPRCPSDLVFEDFRERDAEYSVRGLIEGHDDSIEIEKDGIDLNINGPPLEDICGFNRFRAIDFMGGTSFELAVSSPPNLWPFHISRRLMDALASAGKETHENEDGKRLNDSSVRGKLLLVKYCLCYRNLSVCVFPLAGEGNESGSNSRGTLQDVIELCRRVRFQLSEELLAFFTIEMLRLLEVVHNAGVIHSRVRPEAFSLLQGTGENLESWTKEMKGGWRNLGLALGEFYDAIDVSAFKVPGVQFKCKDVKRVIVPCMEVRLDVPFTEQLDTYAVCDIVHRLIHAGEELTPKRSSTGAGFWGPKNEWVPRFGTKFNQVLAAMFKSLMNVKDNQNPSLKKIRASLEEYLTNTPRLARGLESSLKKLFDELYEYRKAAKQTKK
mmetsp:Transcript_27487/g.66865  ORF Transcript_27487/g.66865 Transcript_27487/m.66865 type:complete len:744 (-) Transcript_27487:62-2293(-)